MNFLTQKQLINSLAMLPANGLGLMGLPFGNPLFGPLPVPNDVNSETKDPPTPQTNLNLNHVAANAFATNLANTLATLGLPLQVPRNWCNGDARSPPKETMETCVLIPPQFSLVVTPNSPKPEMNGLNGHRTGDTIHVWTNERILKGTKFYPFQGTIRLDKLEVFGYLEEQDVKNQFGCYDEFQIPNKGHRIRHCNWVRFLRISKTKSQDVNLVGYKVKGEPVFETLRPIPPNTEILAFLDESGLPDNNNTQTTAEPVTSDILKTTDKMANSYKEAVGLLIEQSPLDLSMSLLSSRMLGPTTCDSDGSLSPPGELRLSPIMPNLSPMPPAYTCSPLPRRPRERTLLPCEVCGKAFDRPSLLKRHMRTHTGEKPHVCDVCGKGFSTSSSLNTHRRIHSGEKPHQCVVCGKRFTASSNLYYHRMTHNKEKPHKCTLCAKSFPTPGDLKSHMYVHSGSWPYKCHVCNRGFSKQTNLKNHLFLHTGDKPHVCELCNKRFALACNLRAHMKTHEDDPQEECSKCGRPFLSSNRTSTNGYCDQCTDGGASIRKQTSPDPSSRVSEMDSTDGMSEESFVPSTRTEDAREDGESETESTEGELEDTDGTSIRSTSPKELQPPNVDPAAPTPSDVTQQLAAAVAMLTGFRGREADLSNLSNASLMPNFAANVDKFNSFHTAAFMASFKGHDMAKLNGFHSLPFQFPWQLAAAGQGAVFPTSNPPLMNATAFPGNLRPGQAVGGLLDADQSPDKRVSNGRNSGDDTSDDASDCSDIGDRRRSR